LATDILRKDPEIAICRQFLVPETSPFWRFMAPESGTRNHQNGAVSGAIIARIWLFLELLPKRFSFFSGAINCQNGSVSGAVNCKMVDRSFMEASFSESEFSF
jgi:hypothetical protein